MSTFFSDWYYLSIRNIKQIWRPWLALVPSIFMPIFFFLVNSASLSAFSKVPGFPDVSYQDFIAPVLRNPRSAVGRQMIPIERDPFPARQRQQTSFYSAKKIRRAYAVRLAQTYSANIPSLTKFSSVIQDPRLISSMTKIIEDFFIFTLSR